MSDCGCDKARAELEEYLHGELRSEEASDIREHVANCEECAGELNVGLTLSAALKQACKEVAPETLRDQVLARLRAEQAVHDAN